LTERSGSLGSWARVAVRLIRRHMRRHAQFIKFIQIGIVNTMFGYGIFALCFLATRWPQLSAVVATVVGVLFNFFTTGRLVFGSRAMSALGPFVLGYVVTLSLNLVLLDAMLGLGVGALLAQALILPITVTLNYLVNSRIVFRTRAN